MIVIWFKILYNKLFIQIIWFLNCYIHISETMRQDNRICKYTYAIFDYFLSMRSVHTMLLGQFLIPHSPEHEFTWYWECAQDSFSVPSFKFLPPPREVFATPPPRGAWYCPDPMYRLGAKLVLGGETKSSLGGRQKKFALSTRKFTPPPQLFSKSAIREGNGHFIPPPESVF